MPPFSTPCFIKWCSTLRADPEPNKGEKCLPFRWVVTKNVVPCYHACHKNRPYRSKIEDKFCHNSLYFFKVESLITFSSTEKQRNQNFKFPNPFLSHYFTRKFYTNDVCPNWMSYYLPDSNRSIKRTNRVYPVGT